MASNTITQTFPINIFSFRIPKIKFNWKVFLFLSFCLILFLSVVYVIQVNQVIKDGYSMKGYQSNLDNLIKENKNLEVNLSQMSYIDKVQQKAGEMGFQKIQSVEYIQILESSLAKR